MGTLRKMLKKIPELKLKIGGRPEGTKVALFRKLVNFTKIFYHFKRLMPFFDEFG
jgi:hypothetical protein